MVLSLRKDAGMTSRGRRQEHIDLGVPGCVDNEEEGETGGATI